MRVLLTSTSYPADAQDWRGRFIADMAAALAEKDGVDLEIWAPHGTLPPGAHHATTEAEALWLDNLTQQGGIAQLLRRRGPFALGAALGLLLRLSAVYRRTDADVLHINWLQNALPLGSCRLPALVTVLGSDFALLKLPGMVTLLRRTLRDRRVILAPNAGWMTDKLTRYFGDLAEVRPIPFGIAPRWFDVARTPPPSTPYHWLAVTRLTPGKLGALFEWGAGIFGDEHVLHLFGPHQDESIILPGWVRYHGPTHPAQLAQTWFPRAAGLITLSRHDEGRPQVVLEAMAAGLPVIASPLAAHREIIRHGATGILVDSPAALRAAVEQLARPSDNSAIGMAAHAWACEHIGTWRDSTERYLAAYRDLLGERRP
jgi:glycosyltransferase involved in cell wall biosynthesis